MKFLFTLQLVIVLIATNLIAHAQMPTIRQIFDFEIGDEFHYSISHYGNPPPEGNRIKIIGKYYSTGLDTLFYVKQNSNYRTYYNPFPNPHLDYVFNNYIDTIFYTTLDSSIQYYMLRQLNQSNYVTTFYIDTVPSLCQNYLIRSISIAGGNFEPTILHQSYSKKLGNVYHSFYVSSSIPIVDDAEDLIYYKKDTISCGTPDTVGLSVISVDMKMKLSIFPNPTSQNLNISLLAKNQNIEEIRIYDLQFKELLNRKINSTQTTIDVSKFAKGVYIVEGKTDIGEAFWKKFVVE